MGPGVRRDDVRLKSVLPSATPSNRSGPPLNISLYDLSVWVLPLVIAITFHEAAHGFVAHRLGDDTAFRLGRVSFNPLKHIDPFGTVMLPGILLLSHSPFLFGYARPVPVNFRVPRMIILSIALNTNLHPYKH